MIVMGMMPRPEEEETQVVDVGDGQYEEGGDNQEGQELEQVEAQSLVPQQPVRCKKYYIRIKIIKLVGLP